MIAPQAVPWPSAHNLLAPQQLSHSQTVARGLRCHHRSSASEPLPSQRPQRPPPRLHATVERGSTVLVDPMRSAHSHFEDTPVCRTALPSTGAALLFMLAIIPSVAACPLGAAFPLGAAVPLGATFPLIAEFLAAAGALSPTELSAAAEAAAGGAPPLVDEIPFPDLAAVVGAAHI
eukprot:3878724-Prymnesium_polylepis.2